MTSVKVLLGGSKTWSWQGAKWFGFTRTLCIGDVGVSFLESAPLFVVVKGKQLENHYFEGVKKNRLG